MVRSAASARDLLDAGLGPLSTRERLRSTVMERLRAARADGLSGVDALAALFPGTVLEPETLEVLTASLLSGSHVIVLGPPGSGKTTLAKEVWRLMPKEVFAVADCPVLDDPFSLIDPVHARRVPPCPYCRSNHAGLGPDRLGEFDPSAIDAADVPVRQVVLREGHGLARVQGSPEVFPDNLTGTINLARLEEIGDPTSPLVLEPGKLLQAHRGLLMVDEVGKLPRGTQNVLLQALQEGIVSPAKSRETFPADLVCISTSNLRDLGNITEPLNDRLANVYTPLPADHASNRRIIQLGLGVDGGAPVPGPYLDAAVALVLRWRGRAEPDTDLAEVGSNRTLIDIVRRTHSYALISGDAVEPDDLRRGASDALGGRVRARSEDAFDHNRAVVRSFVADHWSDAAREGARAYWCRYFTGELAEDKAEGARVMEALAGLVAEAGDLERVRSLLRKDGGDARLRRFADFVRSEEGVAKDALPDATVAVARALDALGAFEADA